ncbi:MULTISPECIES: sugar ABC transporter permease [unclassified Paenibacillus]|uniref:ABC transporter permease n=1 Tax=unclassified Paenibacillus TaxID=185978 RepID=UPI00278A4F28|nr:MULTISPECIES: sugar ABC transporter permease [unclassified Paenibacillus]MDQ0900826.1 putative aldouronate transport system permease protein [Paenibacillus sp. V4I7]MDQ0920667.1 putative aldouronate transport system permease protein [Paenibacillus sp. V4I5]
MNHIAARSELTSVPKAKNPFWKRVLRNKFIYLMVLPGFLYFIIFKYIPMAGLVIAFQDYQPYKGFLGSEWVGLEHFRRLFTDPGFWQIFKNTLIVFVVNIVFYFPIPIILSVMLNEVANGYFKRLVQTIVYIPHFLSWVIIVSISFVMLTMDGGIINEIMVILGLQPVNFLMNSEWFYPMYVLQVIWREAGWGTIVFLAAMASIDPGLYEAARMDGAGRFRQIWHITLPGIRNVIVVLLILKIGNVLDTSFEHIYLILNSMNKDVAEILDTFVYTAGLKQGQFSFSTAVGLFKSVIGFALVVGSNWLAKKFGEDGVY